MAHSTTQTPENRKQRRKKRGNVAVFPGESPPISTENSDDFPPPEPGKVSGVVQPSAEPFPTYPRPKTKGGMVDFKEAIEYWYGLPPEFIERCAVYILRDWPHLDRLRELTDEQRAEIRAGRKKEPFKNIDKIYQPFPEGKDDIRMAFLKRYGSGDYKVYFNDIGVTGSKDRNTMSRNLFKFIASFHDEDFPPILDPSRPDKGLGVLDLDHPQNQSYIAGLRLKGALPPDKKAGDDDVANSDVVKDLSAKVGELASQVAEGKTAGMVSELRAEIREAKKETGGTDKSQELMLGLLTALISKPAPAPVDNSAALIAMFQTQLTALQAELREERESRRKYEADIIQRANVNPFDNFEKMMSMLDKAKSYVTGGGDAAGAIVSHGKTTFWDMARDFGKEFVNSELAAGIGQAIAAKAAQGNPAGPAMSPQHSPAAGPADNNDAAFQRWIAQVVNKQVIRYFLHMHLSGADLADVLYAMEPEWTIRLQNFEHPQLPGLKGKPAILAGYKATGSVWPQIEQAGRATEFEQFVDEFCTWKPDDVAEEEDEEEDDGIIDLQAEPTDDRERPEA